MICRYRFKEEYGETEETSLFRSFKNYCNFFVIFNHSDEKGFFLFASYPINTVQYWLYMLISVFCKISVPVYLMITGALLLKKENESIKAVWTKRLPRYVIVLFLFSFLFFLDQIRMEEEVFSLKKFFLILFTNGWHVTYWYLYAYIAFIMSLPLLRRLVKDMKNQEYIYMIALTVLFAGLIPCLQYRLWQGNYRINSNLNLGWLISSIVIYPCVGYYLEKINITKKKIAVLWALSMVGMAVCCYMTFYLASVTGECTLAKSQTFLSSFVLLQSMALYITCKYICERIKFPGIVNNFIISLGSCTFGIYLLHILVRRRVNVYIEGVLGRLPLNPMISILLSCMALMLVTYVVVWILKCIPGIKKVI